MSLPFTVYSLATGQILRTGFISAGTIESQCLAQEGVLAEPSHPASQWVVEGALQALPVKPAGEHLFDYEAKHWRPDVQVLLRLRTQLLSSSDWRVTKAAEFGELVAPVWQAYRQALRDLPLQSGFPVTVVWPVPPA